MISRLFLLLLLLPGIASIELRLLATDDELPAKQVQWFETNIRPILATKCYSCHAERDDKDEGGLTLDTRQGWEKGGDHGPAIVPKDADASLIIRAVRYSDPDLQMPPDKKLSDRQIKLLEQWVTLGAFDPRKDVQPKSKNDSVDPIAGRSHWAFKPLSLASLSSLKNTSSVADRNWIRSPIDRFVSP